MAATVPVMMTAMRMRALGICLAGLCVFVAAFFLPAVRDPQSLGPFNGWVCAEVALISTASFPKNPQLWFFPLVLSGWVNPLVLLYLASCFWRKLERLRAVLGGLIVVCLVATWLYLAKEHHRLLLGHYLWVAGILLMLAAPLAGRIGRNGGK